MCKGDESERVESRFLSISEPKLTQRSYCNNEDEFMKACKPEWFKQVYPRGGCGLTLQCKVAGHESKLSERLSILFKPQRNCALRTIMKILFPLKAKHRIITLISFCLNCSSSMVATAPNQTSHHVQIANNSTSYNTDHCDASYAAHNHLTARIPAVGEISSLPHPDPTILDEVVRVVEERLHFLFPTYAPAPLPPPQLPSKKLSGLRRMRFPQCQTH